MSSRAELCEYHARECLQAAERTDNPRAREVLIRLARDWLQDALAEARQSKVEHGPSSPDRAPVVHGPVGPPHAHTATERPASLMD
jgi:hypothetical protein